MDPTKRDLLKDVRLCEGLDHGCFLCEELESGWDTRQAASLCPRCLRGGRLGVLIGNAAKSLEELNQLLERIERLAYQVYAHRLEEALEEVRGKGRKGRAALGAEGLQIAMWQ